MSTSGTTSTGEPTPVVLPPSLQRLVERVRTAAVGGLGETRQRFPTSTRPPVTPGRHSRGAGVVVVGPVVTVDELLVRAEQERLSALLDRRGVAVDLGRRRGSYEPTTDSSVGPPPSDADPSEGEKRSWQRPNVDWDRPATIVTALVVFVIVSLVVSVMVLHHRVNSSDAQAGKRTLLATSARQAVLGLVTATASSNPADLDSALRSGTAAFDEEFRASGNAVRRALTSGKVRAPGAIRQVGIVRFDGSKGSLLVVASALVDGAERRYRLRVSMVRRDSRWLIDGMELVK